jgi:Tol biopolymer transport system component
MRRLISLAVIGMTLSGLTVVPGQAHATTPGKNGRILVAADLGLGREIYTIRPDGTFFRQLTELDGNAFHGDWSPDGTRIVFWLEDQAIYIMNANGSDLHEVTAPGGHPSFAPDGEHIVYECFENCGQGGDGIFLMRDDGSDAPGLRLSTNPFVDEGDSDPQVSPDGETVTFIRHKVDGELQALFAVDIDGTDERRVTPYALDLGIKHDWAPDGEHIVITTYADFPNGQNAQVATVKPDGSDLQMLTSTSGHVGAFAGSYSPDGRWIVFRIGNDHRGLYRLMKMRPDGSDRTLIAKFTFFPPIFIDWGAQPES